MRVLRHVLIVVLLAPHALRAAPLASVREVHEGRLQVLALGVEGPRLVARSGESDVWRLEITQDGPRIVPGNVPGSSAGEFCDALLDAALTLDDADRDGRIDFSRGERARLLVSAAWRVAGAWRSALAVIELGTSGAARIAWQRDSTSLPALGRLTSAPVRLRDRRPLEDRIVVGNGWPRDPRADALRAGGEMLAFALETGQSLPSPFRTAASLPGAITALETGGDGITGRLYFADAAWQVWRLDRGRDGRFDATRLADLASLAEPGAALLMAPDVALSVNGGMRSLEVTLGSSDAPGRRAARHWLVVLRDALPGTDAPTPTGLGPIRAGDLRRIDAASAPVTMVAARGLLMALPGPLATAVLTVAGRKLIATRIERRDRCALQVEEAGEEPLTVSVVPLSFPVMSDAPPDFHLATTTMRVPRDSRFDVAWRDGPQPPQLECRLGGAALATCPVLRGLTRDYWVRKDSP